MSNVSVFADHGAELTWCDFHSSTNMLVSSDVTGGVRVWNIDLETPLVNSFVPHAARVNMCRFAPTGDALVSASTDSTVNFTDLTTGQCIRSLTVSNSAVFCIAFSADGQLLAAGSADRTIRIFDTTDYNCAQIFSGHFDAVNSIAFHPDGNLLASGSDDKTVALWDLTTKQRAATLRGHTAGVNCVAFSPDGQLLASASSDGSVLLWNVATPGSGTVKIESGAKEVYMCIFSPDGAALLTASNDAVIRVWCTRTHRQLTELKRHSQMVSCLAYSHDGAQLASSSFDLSLRVGPAPNWDEPAELAPEAKTIDSEPSSSPVRQVATPPAVSSAVLRSLSRQSSEELEERSQDAANVQPSASDPIENLTLSAIAVPEELPQSSAEDDLASTEIATVGLSETQASPRAEAVSTAPAAAATDEDGHLGIDVAKLIQQAVDSVACAISPSQSAEELGKIFDKPPAKWALSSPTQPTAATTVTPEEVITAEQQPDAPRAESPSRVRRTIASSPHTKVVAPPANKAPSKTAKSAPLPRVALLAAAKKDTAAAPANAQHDRPASQLRSTSRASGRSRRSKSSRRSVSRHEQLYVLAKAQQAAHERAVEEEYESITFVPTITPRGSHMQKADRFGGVTADGQTYSELLYEEAMRMRASRASERAALLRIQQAQSEYDPELTFKPTLVTGDVYRPTSPVFERLQRPRSVSATRRRRSTIEDSVVQVTPPVTRVAHTKVSAAAKKPASPAPKPASPAPKPASPAVTKPVKPQPAVQPESTQAPSRSALAVRRLSATIERRPAREPQRAAYRHSSPVHTMPMLDLSVDRTPPMTRQPSAGSIARVSPMTKVTQPPVVKEPVRARRPLGEGKPAGAQLKPKVASTSTSTKVTSTASQAMMTPRFPVDEHRNSAIAFLE